MLQRHPGLEQAGRVRNLAVMIVSTCFALARQALDAVALRRLEEALYYTIL